MTEEIITEKYFDNKDDDFQDFTYYTVREGMHIHLYDAIKKQNEYVQRLEQENKELKARIKRQCYKCRIGDTTEDRLRSALEEMKKR